jgi:hypothetical protein
LFCLHSICYSGWVEIGGKLDNLPKLTDERSVEARISSAIRQYEHLVGANHGIKEANLKYLLVPLSVRFKSDLDHTWVTAMSNFGGDRGKIVHTTWKASHPPDPLDSRNALAKIILPGLKRLDEILTGILSGIPSPAASAKTRRSLFERAKAFLKS